MGFIQESFVCDGCGTPKRDVNHWWSIIFQSYLLDESSGIVAGAVQPVAQDSLSLVQGNEPTRIVQGFVVVPFLGEYSKLQNARCVCGQQCAIKFLDLYMSELLVGSDAHANPDHTLNHLV
jgi:hypothetical protein